jgi:hypothetical protein
MTTADQKSSPILSVRLGIDLKTRWETYCKTLGVAPSSAIKTAIEQQLEKHGRETPTAKNPLRKTYRQVSEALPTEPKHRFEILLTESERRAIRERATSERCSMRRWIIDACRVGLTHEPQFTTKEIETLGESNYQLLVIGRNLNQIARRLNEGNIAQLTSQQIEGIKAQIDRHTNIVSAAMRASLERWDIRS